MRDRARQLHGEPEMRRRHAGPARIGLDLVRPVERRVDLDAREAPRVALEVLAVARELGWRPRAECSRPRCRYTCCCRACDNARFQQAPRPSRGVFVPKENAPDRGRRRTRTDDVLDGVIRRDARRWGREASLGTRPADEPVRRRCCEASTGGGGLGTTVTRTSIFDCRARERASRVGRRSAPRHGQTQRAVAHSELFIGRFAGELNGSDARDTASSRDIRRQTADLEGVLTRALSVGRFTMETHRLPAAGPRHDFRRSNRRLPVAVRDANADAGARVARGARACAPAWPGPSPRAGAGACSAAWPASRPRRRSWRSRRPSGVAPRRRPRSGCASQRRRRPGSRAATSPVVLGADAGDRRRRPAGVRPCGGLVDDAARPRPGARSAARIAGRAGGTASTRAGGGPGRRPRERCADGQVVVRRAAAALVRHGVDAVRRSAAWDVSATFAAVCGSGRDAAASAHHRVDRLTNRNDSARSCRIRRNRHRHRRGPASRRRPRRARRRGRSRLRALPRLAAGGRRRRQHPLHRRAGGDPVGRQPQGPAGGGGRCLCLRHGGRQRRRRGHHHARQAHAGPRGARGWRRAQRAARSVRRGDAAWSAPAKGQD